MPKHMNGVMKGIQRSINTSMGKPSATGEVYVDEEILLKSSMKHVLNVAEDILYNLDKPGYAKNKISESNISGISELAGYFEIRKGLEIVVDEWTFDNGQFVRMYLESEKNNVFKWKLHIEYPAKSCVFYVEEKTAKYAIDGFVLFERSIGRVRNNKPFEENIRNLLIFLETL